MFGLPSHQPGAELRQHTEMEVGIRQLEPERIVPVNAGTHGIGGLTVTQMLEKLENSHQSQPPWRKSGLSTLGIKRLEVLILVEVAELVTQSRHQRAFGKGRTGDPRG